MLGRDWKGIIKYFSLISQIGLQFIFTVLIGGWLGLLIDKKLSTSGVFSIFGILLGVIGGFFGVWKLISHAEKDS